VEPLFQPDSLTGANVGTRTGFGDDALRDQADTGRKSVLRDYAETLLICVIFILFARAFVIQQSEIPSESMEDTLLVGDYILVNRFLYAPTATRLERLILPLRQVQRGEVIVFKHPDEPERDYIKRVIGLPGEKLEIRQGRPWIDGNPLDEPYISELYRTDDWLGPIEIPAGEYFVMGDHRNQSYDSRAWGTVPERLIRGRAFLILLSTNAPPGEKDDPAKVTLRSLPRRLFNLVFRARWDRSLRLID
jgi:signal peptidase I